MRRSPKVSSPSGIFILYKADIFFYIYSFTKSCDPEYDVEPAEAFKKATNFKVGDQPLNPVILLPGMNIFVVLLGVDVS